MTIHSTVRAAMLAVAMVLMHALARAQTPGNAADGAAAPEGHAVFTALHFLTGQEPVDMAAQREWEAKAPLQAGVRHEAVKPGDERFGKHAVTPGAAVLTVVFDEAGKELFRVTGGTFAEFSSRMNEKTCRADLEQFNFKSGEPLAVEGYDIVAYQSEGKAREGNQAIKSFYRGVEYHFSSEDNRRAFAANPEKYLPEYGGWCATAMADGSKVEIDPGNFKVTDGRLFLFYKGLLGNAKKDWVKSEKELTVKADSEWMKLTGAESAK
ncbi:YHS domain-containing protein [Candidatus Poribacteria bacterium]|nr:YHS domain-containing protein [Candidatus Poribacteria bacterium]